MNTSGEVADLMAKEAIQMTESAVKLTALGVKNLAAIVMALANDDGKTEGVAKLKQMLKTGKQLCIMQIKEADLKKFNAEAKNYGIMYRPVADKTNDNGLCDVIAFQDDIPRLNYIIAKAQKILSKAKLVLMVLAVMMTALTGTVFAADPLGTINSLSDFI